MRLQVVFSPEPLVAEGAAERPVRGVSFQMKNDVSFEFKAFPADGTPVRPLPRVDEAVPLQVALAPEPLPTVRAAEGPEHRRDQAGVRVRFSVSSEFGFVSESFVADGAGVRFGSSVRRRVFL